MKHVHLLLGGMTGGALDRLPPTNTGMFALKRMLAPQLVTDWTWGDYRRIAADIRANYKDGDRVIIIGYSGGGSRGTYLCKVLHASGNIPVALFVAYDPSPALQLIALGANVEKAVCYFNEAPGMWWPGVGKIGGGLLTTDGNNNTMLEIVHIREQHLLVQFDSALHKHTCDLIRSL